MSLKKMGQANQYWAVCGVTTVLQALYELNPGQKPVIVGRGHPTAVLAKINEYLGTLKNRVLYTDIEEFTRTFKGYETFSIEQYLIKLDNSVGMKDEDLKKGNYGIALPPHAIVDFLRVIWKIRSTVSYFENGRNGIVGVSVRRSSLDNHEYKSPKSSRWKPYNGLIHYVYRSNGKIYSFGKKYTSLEEVSLDGDNRTFNDYEVECVIELKS